MKVGSRLSFGRFVLLVAVLGTIGCDRVTKHLASSALAGEPGRSYLGDTVWVGYTENPGGFLSVGATLPPLARIAIFTTGTGLLLLAITVALARRRWRGWAALGLTLIAAGGASNWIDRVAAGRVVDFIAVGVGPLRTGVFNVADVAITAGIAIFAVTEFAGRRRAARASAAG